MSPILIIVCEFSFIQFSLGFRVTDLNHLLLLLLVHHIEDLFNEGLLEEQRRDLSSLV